MKKAFLVFFLLISFIQCSPDNDVEKEEQQAKPGILIISVTIEGEFLNENREKILYISNQEGNIEGQITLLNNQENVLTLEKAPDTKYDLVVHDILTYNGRTRQDFNIFQNIQSSSYTINANAVINSGELPKVDLHIKNAGNLKRIGMTGGGSSSLSSEDGGTFSSSGKVLSNPGDYYYSFIKSGEPFARYFWTENVEEDKSFALNYEELPVAPLIETQLPENERATLFIHGYRSEYPSVGHRLSHGTIEGIKTYKTYFPEAIFDYISFTAGLFDGTTSYSFYSVSEVIPSGIEIPSFDFTTNNFSIDDTQYTTTGNYDISNATFVISEDNINIQALVKVYSEPGSKISFSISPLINSLFAKIPSLDAAQLEPLNIALSSYNYHGSYAETVKGLIEGANPRTPGNSSARISRKKN